MKAIHMTEAQTDLYNSDDDRAMREMLDPIREMAQQEADRTGECVEIYTTDGTVAVVAEPDYLAADWA